MTKWLITGAGGQLAADLRDVLRESGDQVDALDRAALDLTDPSAVREAMARLAPDVVLNTAAYTAVDAAEADEERAYQVNAQAPAWLAMATAESGSRLIHVSTDYVFAGNASQPYGENDPAEPRTAYGRTKLAGEQAVLALDPKAYVVRTAWLYGSTGGNFVKTMLRLAREKNTVQVVDDQRGAPTWSRDLARGLVELGRSDAAPGVLHCTNTGEATWFEFARAVFAVAGLDPARVRRTATDLASRPAPRPAYSVLGMSRWDAAGLTAMPHWRDALDRAMPHIQGASA
jgi:dTDP-4-dehydrorhamnose reductase